MVEQNDKYGGDIDPHFLTPMDEEELMRIDVPEIPSPTLKNKEPSDLNKYERDLREAVAAQYVLPTKNYLANRDYESAWRLIDDYSELSLHYGKELADALYQSVPRIGKERERVNLNLLQIRVLETLNRKGARLDLDEVVLQYYARLQPDGRWCSRGNDYQMYRIHVPDFFGKVELGGRCAYRKAVQEAKSAVVKIVKDMLLDGADYASFLQANYQPGKLKRDKAVKIKVTLGELVE